MAKSAPKKYLETVEAYKQVFQSPAGEAVLLDLMKVHNILSNTYSGNVNDMLIKEGERNVVLRIIHLLKLDVKAIYERIDRESQDVG